MDNRPACGQRPPVGSTCYGADLDRLKVGEGGLSGQPGPADIREPEWIKARPGGGGPTGQDAELAAGALPPDDEEPDDEEPDDEEPDDEEPDDDEPDDEDEPLDELEDDPESPPEDDSDFAGLAGPPAAASELDARESVR
ncbi:hypothetical protein [Micromonospora sp. NPDC005413]|uniref:hypothetical protein n=1 Tax=Micromonospora sp. NPDC005413 TaxID=3154563 RepID=UPI0033B09836